MTRVVLLLLCPWAAIAEDSDNGQGQLEPPFTDNENFSREFTEEQLRDLPLSDPTLRVAYFMMVKGAVSELADKRYPRLLEVLKDVKRRGDTTTPLWLDMMAKNQETSLEYKIPLIIGRVGTIKMGPYVDYLRQMIQTRGDSINGTIFQVALDTFFEYGNKEDVQLALDLAKKRPFLADYVQSSLDTDRRRKAGGAPKPSSPETSPAPAQAKEQQAPEMAPTKAPAPSGQEKGAASPSNYLTMAVGLIVVTLGLCCFLLKRRKR